MLAAPSLQSLTKGQSGCFREVRVLCGKLIDVTVQIVSFPVPTSFYVRLWEMTVRNDNTAEGLEIKELVSTRDLVALRLKAR